MAEAVIIAWGILAGVDWRLLGLVAGAVWVPMPAAIATATAVIVSRRRLAASRVGAEIQYIETMVGELRAGASVRTALAIATRSLPDHRHIGRRLQVGDPVGAAVAGLDIALPRVGSLVRAAVQAGVDGGRLIPVLEELMVHAVAEEEVAQEMRAATAQVRASMTVLVGGPAAYVAWSVGSGRFARLLALPGGTMLAAIGGAPDGRRGDSDADAGEDRAMMVVVSASLGVIFAGWAGGAAAVAVAAALKWQGRRRRPSSSDPVAAATHLLVAVGAGIPLIPALEGAVRQTGSTGDLEDVVRRSRRYGSSVALAGSTGPLGPLLRRLAAAALSGAPLEPAIRSYLETERRRRHTAAIERARRLPVRLMVPMTLLVLPGFVLLVYGPELIGLVMEVVGPLVS